MASETLSRLRAEADVEKEKEEVKVEPVSAAQGEKKGPEIIVLPKREEDEENDSLMDEE